jgi:SAM-dependent methyltransferase
MVDFGKTAEDYGRHRAGFPDRFFARLFDDAFVAQGDRILDLGTGTGTVARGLAKRGCNVTGLDPSMPLLETARRLDREEGLETAYINATAEHTGAPAGSFDVVTAGQCWHWFDRPRAALEAKRVLLPGGRLIIAHFDWLPLSGNVVEATEQLILAHNPEWHLGGGTGIYPKWFADLSAAGFLNIESFSFDLAVPYSHEAWLGRIRASAGIGASLSPGAVAAFNTAHAELLLSKFPQNPLEIPHRVFAVTGLSERLPQD